MRSHAPDGRLLFRIGELEVRQGDRLMLLGCNGVGKSRFAAMLRRATMEGRPACKSASAWCPAMSTRACRTCRATGPRIVSARPGIGDGQATRLLTGAGFSAEAQGRPIDRLLPGQKARPGLLALQLKEPNFYLLDEPTNHLDIPGQKQLEAELLAPGVTCILISHDRSFVEAVGTRFLLIEDGQALKATDAASVTGRWT